MPASLAIPVFAASLAVTLYAAATFAGRLEHLARRLGFAEAVIGLLTALAADGPEIVSALVRELPGIDVRVVADRALREERLR